MWAHVGISMSLFGDSAVSSTKVQIILDYPKLWIESSPSIENTGFQVAQSDNIEKYLNKFRKRLEK